MEKAGSAPLNVVPKPARGHHSPFPCYLDLVKRQLLKEYREADLRTMGLRIFTTLDPQVQVAAEQGTAAFMKNRDKNLEAGVMITSRTSNEIQAVVGGKAFRSGGFNRPWMSDVPSAPWSNLRSILRLLCSRTATPWSRLSTTSL